MIDIVKLVNDFNSGKWVCLMGDIYDKKRVGEYYKFNSATRNYIKKGLIPSMTVPMRTHQDFIGNKDIEEIGYFTVGKGKVKYHDFIWHSTGSCTVQPLDRYKHSPRFLKGDEMITIHFN